MKTLCVKMDSNIRYRLRMCIWKHWKTPQNRAKNLIKLGINKYTAWKVAYAGARIAYVCNKGVSYVKLIEPPCTERYARWCERSGNLLNFPPTRLPNIKLRKEEAHGKKSETQSPAAGGTDTRISGYDRPFGNQV